MKESDFSKQVRDELKLQYNKGVALYLIQDSPRSGKKPYDAYMTYKLMNHGTGFMALEFKMVKNGVSIFRDSVTLHQEDSLLRHAETGHKAMIVICVYHHKFAFVIPVRLWIELWEYFGTTSMKIVQLKNVLPEACIMEKVKFAGSRVQHWDVVKLFRAAELRKDDYSKNFEEEE